MKHIKKAFSVLLVAAAVSASPAIMANTVKPYHQEMMQDSSGKSDCSLCHDKASRFTTPPEENCMSCHGTKQELAELTKRNNKDHSIEPNPHNSLHYSTDLACSFCHSEHKESQVYCNNCHEFDYPKMKR